MDCIFIQQQDDYPRIKCDKHIYYFLEYINFDLQKGRVVNCPECIADSEIIGGNLIPLMRLFKKDQDYLLTKWPVLKRKENLQKIKNSLNEENRHEQIELIENVFNDLKANMNQLIEESKKKILTKIVNISKQYSLISQDIKDLINIDPILSCFSQYSNNVNELNQALQSQINLINSTQNVKAQQIIDKLDQLSKIESQINMDLIKNLSDKLIAEYNNIAQSITEFEIQDNSINNQFCQNQFKNILPQLQVFQTPYDKSDRCHITKLFNNQIVIENDQLQVGCRQVYLDYILDKTKKYQIEIQLLDSIYNNSDILLGLMPKNNLNINGWRYNLSLYTSGQDYGITKVQKGEHLSNVSDGIDSICFQIYLEQKILKCYGVANNQLHCNEICNSSLIKDDQDYCFYIASYHNSIKIKIVTFQEVQEFIQI